MAGHHLGVVALICGVLLVLPSWSESNQSNDDVDKPILPSSRRNNPTMVNNDETLSNEELKNNAGKPHGKSKKRTKNKKKMKAKKYKEKNKYKNNSPRNGGWSCRGVDCCSSKSPCQYKQGDCKTDRNSDCAGSLICGKDNCQDFHSNANKWKDCCTTRPGAGGPESLNFCTKAKPCQAKQGDCDTDSECADGLICGESNCKDFHPFTLSETDCCTTRPGTGTSESLNFCTKAKPCQDTQGDCDSDSECADGLICGESNCKDFHPLALSGTDCCIKKNYHYCGIENKNRISGGSETGENQYPWMVRLPMGCGGALITNRHILTARHCLCWRGHHSNNNCKKNKKKCKCKWDSNGKWAPTTSEATSYWWGRAVKLSVHDQYDATDYAELPIKEVRWPIGNDHDLAMVILDKPTYTIDKPAYTIGTVCAPSSANKDYRGKVATAMGWGMTHYLSSQSPVLKHVKLTVSLRQEKNFLYTEVPDINGVLQDACAGDSGGPLVYRDVYSARWIIIGTLKGYGYNCRTGKINGEGKWNKVTDHLDWIENNLY